MRFIISSNWKVNFQEVLRSYETISIILNPILKDRRITVRWFYNRKMFFLIIFSLQVLTYGVKLSQNFLQFSFLTDFFLYLTNNIMTYGYQTSYLQKSVVF